MRLIALIALSGAAAAAAALIPAAVSGAPPRPVLVAGPMNGHKEIHGPTYPDARGRAVIEIRRKRQRLCFFVEFQSLGAPQADGSERLPSAGHIHSGRRDEVGPVALALFATPAPSPVEGCLKRVSLDLLNQLVNHPRRFYVNLHTDEYPEGVIRSQLRPRK